MIDPRRPRQKPTSQELEEGLVQYDPVLPDNPKSVLSHEYEVRSFLLPRYCLDIETMIRSQTPNA